MCHRDRVNILLRGVVSGGAWLLLINQDHDNRHGIEPIEKLLVSHKCLISLQHLNMLLTQSGKLMPQYGFLA